MSHDLSVFLAGFGVGAGVAGLIAHLLGYQAHVEWCKLVDRMLNIYARQGLAPKETESPKEGTDEENPYLENERRRWESDKDF